jgi:hypothetical protein
LREKKPFGGFGKASMDGHGVEGFELGVGHRHAASSNKLSLCVKYDKSILFIKQ